LVGGLVSTIGIFLPGLLFCFFIIRFWSHFKKYRLVKASLEGITAVSSGLVIAAAMTLFEPMPKDIPNITAMAITFILLMLTKIPSPLIVLAGLLAGLLLPI
jgi:chromate transporter